MAAGTTSTHPHRPRHQQELISMYVSAGGGEVYVAERYKDSLPKATIGRSCVRFNRLSDVDQAVLNKPLKEGTQATGKV